MDFKETISFDEFDKIDLRIGEIIACQKVEKSDKLLLLNVKIGTEVRQIVSGIAEHYAPDQIVGKKVVVVANLAPTKIRGNLSSWMLLCAVEDGKLELLETPNMSSGSRIK